MKFTSPDYYRQQVALSTRAGTKVRIRALLAISRPTLVLLQQLLTDKRTPPELRLVAADLYEKYLIRRDALKRHAQKSTQ